MSEARKGRPGQPPRRAARLAAVQALYQMDMAGADPASVIREFLDHRWDADGDRVLFSQIVAGAKVRQADLDQMIGGSLAEGWSVERLETVLRAILRSGVWELAEQPETPPLVIIKEYVGIAHGFYGGREPAMVHAVLDRLAHKLREAELPARGGEQVAR